MSIPVKKWTKWFFLVFLAGCWAYAFCARFTGFIGAPRWDKLTLLGSAFLISGLLAFFLVFSLFPRWLKGLNRTTFIWILFAGALLAAAFQTLKFTPPPFPENHSLEITTLNQGNPLSAGYWVQIFSIERISLPKKTIQNIFPQELDLQGDWQIHAGDNLLWQGGVPGTVRYQAFMQAGINLVFQTGPEQGIVQIKWDGNDQNIDLYSPVEGIRGVVLWPGLNWRQSDNTRKLFVLAAFLAEFISLSVLISMAILLVLGQYQRGWSIRQPGLLISSTFVLLLLLFINLSLLQPIHFSDPNLEIVIRELLENPDQPISHHEVLSIVKLDAADRNIAKLDGIQYLRNLSELDLRDNQIRDISPLSRLSHLSVLNLRGNAISDLSPISRLTNLSYLNIHSNPNISSIAPLSNLTRLESLIMRNVPVGDEVDLLRNFPNLKKLNLRNTGLCDTAILGELMSKGILQDNQTSGVHSTINILDNPIFNPDYDTLNPIRPYWANITFRAPFILPENYTLEAPTFSHQAGFYSSAFFLEISNSEPHTSIYYTLDGSEPTRDSTHYRNPILIESRLGEPNRLSTVVCSKSPLGIPDGEIFKATVVRAKAFDNLYKESSPTITRTFFIDEYIQEKYTFPVISLVTDSENFFDNIHGIYRHYDEKGRMWERPLNIEIFESGGNPVLSAGGSVCIQGQGSNGYPQKSLRIYARNSNQFDTYFSYAFFPGLENRVNEQPIKDYRNIVLRNSGNDWYRSLFRDALMHNLISHKFVDTQAFRPVVAFINGEYWGIYHLRQRFDEYYLASKYGVDPDRITIMTAEKVHFNDGLGIFRGHPEEEAYYKDMLEFLANEDIKKHRNLEYINTLMDIDNFIDYHVAEIYCANPDWPHNNSMWWRVKTDHFQSDAPPGQDGRWRWILIDTDLGFGWEKYGEYNHNTLKTSTQNTVFGFLLSSLLKNEEFRNQFINNFADHLNTSFKEERVIEIIDEMQSVLYPEIEEHIRRWRTMGDSVETWELNVEELREFARNRPEIVRQHIIDQFNLPGTVPVTLQTDPTKGYIQINSIAITRDTPGVVDPSDWTGEYFQGVPIQFSAMPFPGYQFESWQGLGQDSNEAEITINLAGDLVLKANFIPEP